MVALVRIMADMVAAAAAAAAAVVLAAAMEVAMTLVLEVAMEVMVEVPCMEAEWDMVVLGVVGIILMGDRRLLK
jgi:hypothetical protein